MNKKYYVAAWLALDKIATKAGLALLALASWARNKASRHFPLLLVTTAVESLRIVSVAILLSPVLLLGAFI